VPLELPALRQRREDLGLLTVRLIARRTGQPPARLDRAAARALFGHDWPENIRELDQRVNAALALGDATLAGVRISPAPAEPAGAAPDAEASEPPAPSLDRDALAALLSAHRGNVSHVAKARHVALAGAPARQPVRPRTRAVSQLTGFWCYARAASLAHDLQRPAHAPVAPRGQRGAHSSSGLRMSLLPPRGGRMGSPRGGARTT